MHNSLQKILGYTYIMRRLFSSNSLWLAAAAGVLHSLSFPPVSWWPLALCSLVPLLVFIYNETKWWRLVLGSYIYCGIYAVYTIIWMPDPLLIGVGVSIFTVTFVPLVLLAKRFIHSADSFLVAGSLAVLAGELTGAYFLFLPAFFIMSGIPLAGTPLQYFALAGGVIGTSAFVMICNAAFAYALLMLAGGKHRPAAWGAALFLLLIVMGTGMCFLVHRQHQSFAPLRVMTVSVDDTFAKSILRFDQPDFLQTPGALANLQQIMQAKLAPIGDAVEKEHPTLVVLPQELFESEFPKLSYEPARADLGITNNGPVLSVVSDFAQDHRVPVMVTLVTFDDAHHKYWSTVLVDKDGHFTQVYRKHFLTFVSDYWPFGHWLPFYWRWSYDILPAAARHDAFATENPTGPFTAGESTPTTFSIAGVPVGAFVCMEGNLPYVYWRRAWQGDSLIVSSGGDTWLPRLAPLYDAYVYRLRRLESINAGLPTVVASDGEAPMFILPDGTTEVGIRPSAAASWTYLVR